MFKAIKQYFCNHEYFYLGAVAEQTTRYYCSCPKCDYEFWSVSKQKIDMMIKHSEHKKQYLNKKRGSTNGKN